MDSGGVARAHASSAKATAILACEILKRVIFDSIGDNIVTVAVTR
jgi:hypothetical protein